MIRGLAGAVRVEADRDPVVAERGVALADGACGCGPARVEAVKREVDVAVVVGDADLGAEVGGHLVAADRAGTTPTHRPESPAARATTPHRRGRRRSVAARRRAPRRIRWALCAGDDGEQHAQQRKDGDRFHDGSTGEPTRFPARSGFARPTDQLRRAGQQGRGSRVRWAFTQRCGLFSSCGDVARPGQLCPQACWLRHRPPASPTARVRPGSRAPPPALRNTASTRRGS